MTKRGRHIIGIAVTRDALLLAEVRLAGGQPQVLRQSTLPFKLSALNADPRAVGSALAAHLRDHHYTSKDAVVGLPAQWLMTRIKEIAAVKDDQARQNMIRLAIEREFKARASQWTFDYAMVGGEDASETGTRALLVAARTDLLQQLTEMLSAAKLHPVRVMPSALAVMPTVKAGVAGALYLSPAGNELVHYSGSQPVAISYLPGDADAIAEGSSASLAAAVSRSLAAVGNARQALQGKRDELLLIADKVAREQTLDSVKSALAGRFTVLAQPEVDTAAALASSETFAGLCAIDLLHHKLLPAARKGMTRGKRAGVIAAALALLLIFLTGYRWYRASSTLAQLQAASAAIAEDAQMLQAVREHLAAAEPWFDDRPTQLDCLAVLTDAIPSSGTIWVTNLTLDHTLAGSVKCKADREGTMLAYLQAMQDAPALGQVQLRDWNQAQRDASLVVFEITFTYLSSAKGAM